MIEEADAMMPRVPRSTVTAVGLAFALTLVAAPAPAQGPERLANLGGDGVGIFVNGRLACWLGLDAARRRGSISFTLTKDGLACSIASVTSPPKRRLAATLASRSSQHGIFISKGTKCFFFDGRQFCE